MPQQPLWCKSTIPESMVVLLGELAPVFSSCSELSSVTVATAVSAAAATIQDQLHCLSGTHFYCFLKLRSETRWIAPSYFDAIFSKPVRTCDNHGKLREGRPELFA